VEPRALFVIRNEFECRKLDQNGAIPKEHFCSIVNTAFKGKLVETKKAAELIIEFVCVNEKGDMVNDAFLERYTDLHDFF